MTCMITARTRHNRRMFGTLTTVPARDRLDLLAEAVAAALTGALADVALVTEIDPAVADTAALSARYGVPLEASGNCVIVLGKRAGEQRAAACVVRADTRVDVNNVVRRRLDVRKASFAPQDFAVQESGMEYGAITPVGVPPAWPILVDRRVVETALVMLGSGLRRSKLVVPGSALAQLPGAEVVDGLGI